MDDYAMWGKNHPLNRFEYDHMSYSQNLPLMESSIRDIFIFLKLSWGLEDDNTLFKKR